MTDPKPPSGPADPKPFDRLPSPRMRYEEADGNPFVKIEDETDPTMIGWTEIQDLELTED